MPLFYFVLKAGTRTIPDVEGEELGDEVAARDLAVTVARELMIGREAETWGWRVQVNDDYLNPVFEVSFAEVVETLYSLPPPLWTSIESVARTGGSLQ